jgi:hypothetical protein
VGQNPALSGRDVKNLLKLAAMMTGGDVTPDAVRYVRQFKATKDLSGGGAVPLPGSGAIGKAGHQCGAWLSRVKVGPVAHRTPTCPKGA